MALSIIKKPWGFYRILEQTNNFWIKLLTIYPFESISLQYHKHRIEEWIIISGYGLVYLNEKKFEVEEKDFIKINDFQVHRIINRGPTNLVFLETAFGNCKEQDIIRLDDKYGRAKF